MVSGLATGLLSRSWGFYPRSGSAGLGVGQCLMELLSAVKALGFRLQVTRTPDCETYGTFLSLLKQGLLENPSNKQAT